MSSGPYFLIKYLTCDTIFALTYYIFHTLADWIYELLQNFNQLQ